jgi:hypothetical protein
MVTSSMVAGCPRYEADSKRELMDYLRHKLYIEFDILQIKTDSTTGKVFFVLKK